MDELVKNYIEAKKAEIKKAEEEKINKYLMAHGLYRDTEEKEYTNLGVCEAYPLYDRVVQKAYRMKKEVVSISDEDLAELKAITDKLESVPAEDVLANNVATIRNDVRFFKVLTIIYIILSVIVGIVLATSI